MMNTNHYERIKSAFSRGVGGAFVPKECTDDIKKLENDGYLIVVYEDMPIVKVVNEIVNK